MLLECKKVRGAVILCKNTAVFMVNLDLDLESRSRSSSDV